MKISVFKPTPEQIEELGLTKWDTWESEPSTFDWYYDLQETCYILEGKVTVKTEKESVSFGKGDMVIFPSGLACVWQVHEKVRKHFKFN